ncbi:MAG: DUF433 domain-containing protein [Candidatus Hydrogenedentes bacterium]|nr:DUF433 domain-containing protein [Candidatus Hydrogenedentota bacterium]
MDLPERIHIGADDKPCIRDTGITVEHVIGLLAQGWTKNEILTKHANISIDDIRACFKYVAMVLHEQSAIHAS